MHRTPLTLMSAFTLACAVPVLAQQPDPALLARRTRLHDAGVQAGLTIHAVRLLGRPSTQVGEALGLVLEQYGMPELAVAEPFDVGAETPWEQVPAAFGAHVAKIGGGDRHHLYAEFLGTPRTGPEEVRFVVVDGSGAIVWTDRQTKADAAFRKTAAKDPDPLGCATLVAERLFTLAEWRKAPGSVRDGRMQARFRDRSGVPDQQELAAMKERLAALREALPKTRLCVWPVLANGKRDAEAATRLAAALHQELGCATTTMADAPELAVAPAANQQKRMWDLARAAKAALGEVPADAGHVLVVDLGVDGSHGFVHTVLCTGKGDWVAVEFANDQHRVFQKVAPTDAAAAEAIVVTQLRERLR